MDDGAEHGGLAVHQLPAAAPQAAAAAAAADLLHLLLLLLCGGFEHAARDLESAFWHGEAESVAADARAAVDGQWGLDGRGSGAGSGTTGRAGDDKGILWHGVVISASWSRGGGRSGPPGDRLNGARRPGSRSGGRGRSWAGRPRRSWCRGRGRSRGRARRPGWSRSRSRGRARWARRPGSKRRGLS